jgi:hypothetical protein
LAEFQFLADWTPDSPDLNSLNFSISCFLQAKVLATPYSNLIAIRPSITTEWYRLAAVYILKTCISFRCRQEAAAKKNEVKTE